MAVLVQLQPLDFVVKSMVINRLRAQEPKFAGAFDEQGCSKEKNTACSVLLRVLNGDYF